MRTPYYALSSLHEKYWSSQVSILYFVFNVLSTIQGDGPHKPTKLDHVLLC